MKEINIKESLIFGRKINDLKEAIEHLNEEGYFSDFEDFSEYKEGVLEAVAVSNDSYYPYTNSYDVHKYKFFAVKSQTVLIEEHMKYEPFIYKSELPFTVGDKIIFRAKKSDQELLALVNGIKYSNDLEQKIVGLILGCTYCNTVDLFNNYELWDSKEFTYKPLEYLKMKKIDTKQSLIYRFDDNRKDLADCVEKLGTNGYFSNVEDFEFYDTGVLTRVISDVNNYSYPFVRGDNAIEHKYFIPEDKVVFREEEKKFRPYMYLDELPFNIGDVVYYRCKQCCSECRGIVTEIEYQNNEDGELDNIIIGGIDVTPQELFEQYELKNDDCEYVPFGFEE